jgi:hypothetical protein
MSELFWSFVLIIAVIKLCEGVEFDDSHLRRSDGSKRNPAQQRDWERVLASRRKENN